MRSVQVYVEGQRLELFNDEQITVKSEQQNIADISAVRTDFSQTFTIPASINNNKIFKHFYESSVDSNTDHNIRRSATIEIDLVPFTLIGATTRSGLLSNPLRDLSSALDEINKKPPIDFRFWRDPISSRE